jgi:hypothetical protein
MPVHGANGAAGQLMDPSSAAKVRSLRSPYFFS